VAQQEQFDAFGRGCAAEQGQPPEELAEDQVEQAKRNGHDRAGPLVPITTGQELRPTSGTPHAASWQQVARHAQLTEAIGRNLGNAGSRTPRRS
jgi:hypothetical protein